MLFKVLLGVVSVIAGAVASLAGFGIGSLVTPFLALQTGIGIAVAAVSIAHFFGTALRFWFWRKHIDKKILISFGLASAAGGLAGALLHNIFYNSILTVVFGCLLVFAGITGLTGLAEKFRLAGTGSWIAGTLSGLFGGLVGNQGGIRSAAMLGFDLERKAFVATSTGIALMVDIARVPVYLAASGRQLAQIWPLIVIATICVLVGTAVGSLLLKKIPESIFKKVVSGIILVIGIFILIHK